MSSLVVVDVVYRMSLIDALNIVEAVARVHPGDCRVALEAGGHRLTLGRRWAVDASPACLTDLAQIGDVRAVEEPEDVAESRSQPDRAEGPREEGH